MVNDHKEHHLTSPAQCIRNVISRVRTSSGRSNRGSSCISICNHGEFKILVIGSQGVGKSLLCRKYVGLSENERKEDDIPYDAGVFIDMNGEVRQYDLEIYDMDCDSHDFKKYKQYIDNADGFMLVYGTNSKQSLLKFIQVISDIKRSKRDAPMVLLGNKFEKDAGVIHESDILAFNLDHFNVSAIKNEGIPEAFRALVTKCAVKKDKDEGNPPKRNSPIPPEKPFVSGMISPMLIKKMNLPK